MKSFHKRTEDNLDTNMLCSSNAIYRSEGKIMSKNMSNTTKGFRNITLFILGIVVLAIVTFISGL